MQTELSSIASTARDRQLTSQRCLKGSINLDDFHNWGGKVEEAALRFLEASCANEYWFFRVLEQAALHAIGPRIQLAHVVYAITTLRRFNAPHLLDRPPETLKRGELAQAVAVGSIVLSDDGPAPSFFVNPILQADFDPAQAAIPYGGISAG